MDNDLRWGVANLRVSPGHGSASIAGCKGSSGIGRKFGAAGSLSTLRPCAHVVGGSSCGWRPSTKCSYQSERCFVPARILSPCLRVFGGGPEYRGAHLVCGPPMAGGAVRNVPGSCRLAISCGRSKRISRADRRSYFALVVVTYHRVAACQKKSHL